MVGSINPFREIKKMPIVEPSIIDCVIYHADCTDGFGAAYSAWKLLGNRAEYHACKHGSPPPDIKGKNVAILVILIDEKNLKEQEFSGYGETYDKGKKQ